MSDENNEGVALEDDPSSESAIDEDMISDGFEDKDDPGGFEEPDAGDLEDEPAAESEPADDAEPESGESAEEGEWVTDQLRSAGKMIGMSEIEMRRFGSPEALETAIIEEATLRTQDEGGAVQQDVAPRGEFNLNLSPDDFDPAVIKAFENLHGHHNTRTAQLEGALVGMAEMLERFMQNSHDSELDRYLDGRFASLGGEFEDIFGTGTVETVDRSSKAYGNRVLIRDEIAGRLRNGRDSSRTESFDRALRAIFGDRMESLARKKITSSVKKRGSQSIARPTRRTAPPQGNTELDIVGRLRGRMRDKGMLEH